MRIKTKLPLNSYNLSKSFYIIVIILPLCLLMCCAAVQNSEAATADGIKVMSINLLFSEIDDRNKRLKIIADYIAENDVDFVLLQEVVGGDLVKTNNSAKDLKEFIFERHDLKYYKRTETEDIPIPFGSDLLRVGNGILSRYKIEYSDAKKLPKTSESEVFGIYKLDFKRNVMMLRSTVNGYGPIHVYNTHLCSSCKTKEREEQLDVLLKYVKKEEENIPGENPVILGGDFNIDRIKKAGVENYLYEEVLWEGFIDAYAAAAIDPLDELCEDKDNPDEHCTIGVTDLGDSNPGRIDYIFAKDFRKVTNSQVIFNSAITDDPAVSDHSAVSVSLVGNFEDIPPGYWAEEHIYKSYEAGITAGCSQDHLMYCPEDAVTRAEMAVFLERGINGSDYDPPGATGIFDDVPVSYWAADWVEQFYADGITGGCSTDPPFYCPDDLVTRAEMTVFLLRSMNGEDYTPPSAVGIFDDVPVTHWAANWIEALYDEGISGGCSTDPPLYCPDDLVTRAAMAVFIVRAFDL